MATLAISPSWIPLGVTDQIVTFIGIGTAWESGAPTFTPSGVSGVEIGDVTVVSDLVATAPVTTGSTAGVVTWTDSTTSATAKQNVGPRPPRWTPKRR